MKAGVLALLAGSLIALGLPGCASKRPRPEDPASRAPADTVHGRGSAPGAGHAPGGPSQPGQPPPGIAAPAGKAGADSARRAAGKADTSGTGKAGPAASAEVVVESPAPPRAEPLIMENADRMEGFRSRGEYILSGKVRFTHGDLRLETDRAVWQKDRSLVFCESGMKITHRGALLTSERGSYDKNLGEATAEGKVRMRDSSGEVEAFGHTVTYNRNRHLATLSGAPELRRYYRKQADSAAKAAGGAAGTTANAPSDTAVRDTLTIRGRVLTYNDSARIATADGSVNITRDKVSITCQKAEYHDAKDSLYLLGQPQVLYDESRIKGVSMRLNMDGEEIKSLLVKGDAQAKSVEPATDTSVARQSDVQGDSLFLAFKDRNIDSVQVFRNAKGSYFDVDKPDFVNRMSGEYMVLRFDKKKVQSAGVLGKAKSTYFHLERRTFKGRNEAEGDTIDFAFKDGKVEEVMVRGQARGTYFGEPQAREGKADSAKADSAAAPKAVPGAGRGAPSAGAGASAAAAPRPPRPVTAAPATAPVAAPAGRSPQPSNSWRR